MAPDLNSLPPSRSTSSSPIQPRATRPAPSSEPFRRETPSPRSSSVSLAAAATMNAADISRRSSTSNNLGSPRAGRAAERRRSQVAMNLNLNDPTMPAPGELSSSDHRSSIGNSFRTASPTNIGGQSVIATGDPHHQRAPSLGEMHQELEQEQEAQVNRLLQMIRHQQAQLNQMQIAHQQHSHGHSGSSPLSTGIPPSQAFPATSTAIDDSTPTSELGSFSLPGNTPINLPISSSISHRPSGHRRRSSQSPSPALRPAPSAIPHHESSLSSTSEGIVSPSLPHSPSDLMRRPSRDETAFYQAETANLTRENQLLRQRVRALEKQVQELGVGGSSTGAATSSGTTTRQSTSDSRGSTVGLVGGNAGVARDVNAPGVTSGLTREVTEENMETDSKRSAVGASGAADESGT